MSNYKRKEVFDYLTRKPVTTQDIELARTRIQTPVTPLPMQVTSGEERVLDGQLELAEGGRVDFEKAGRALTKNNLEQILKRGNLKNFEGTTEELSNLAKQYIENYAGGSRTVASEQLDYYTDRKSNNFTKALRDRGVDNTALPAMSRTTSAPKYTQKQVGSPITGEAAELSGTKLLNWIKKQNQIKNYDDINFYKAIEKYKNQELGGNLNQFWEKSGLSRSNIEKSLARSRGFTFTTLGKDYLKDRITDQLNLIKNDKDVLNFIKDQDFRPSEIKKISNKVSKIIDTNNSIAARRIADLSDAFNGSNEYVNIKTTNKDLLQGAYKISDIKEKNFFKDFGSGFKRIDAEKSVSKQLGEKPSFMRTTRDFISSYLPKKISVDETKNIASSGKYGSGAYSMFLQGIKEDINSYKKRPLDIATGKAEKLLQDLDIFDPDYEEKRNLIKDNYNQVVEDFTSKINKNLKSGELPVRALKLSFDPPSDVVANYEDLPKNIKKNITDLYNNHEYSFEVPKDLMYGDKAREYVKSPEGQEDILKRNRQGQNRVFFESLDPGSPLRKAVGYFPGSAIPLTLFDAVTLPLAGYSIPESAVIASQNLLKNPYIAGAANIATQMYDIQKGGGEEMISKANERRQGLEQNITDIKNKLTGAVINNDIPNYSEGEVQMKTGGRVKLQNGTEEPYNPEIPSLGFSDPIDILEQQMINEKDTGQILALNEILTEMKKRKAAEEKAAEEYKISQKQKGVRYKEDYPSEADYFLETGKQLLTNPKYFLGKGAKGAVEATEWLVGQPLQTLFNQEGKNFEFYKMVGGEKLGINKFIEENIPKNPTTGTLLAGEATEIAGSIFDPFLAYGIVKGVTKASKTKTPVVIDETVDPTKRDLLKIGAVLTGGAIAYPTAKKLGLLDNAITASRVGKGVRIATNPVVNNMPEFFPYLSEFSLRKGISTGDYMRSGMTEFKRELNLPLEIQGKKTNVKLEFIHNPAEGNVTAYYTNPLTDEKFAFDYYAGKQGRQAYGIDPKHPGAWEYHAVEVEPPGFYYKGPDKSDPYRKTFDYFDTSTEGDEVIEALDKWYKGLSKEEKATFENKFITHTEYTDEIGPASWAEEENYPIMEGLYPKKIKE
jgi:hypothetical protein